MSPNDASPSPPVSSTYDRVRVLDNPFAHLVSNNQVSKFCSYCMRAPDNDKLLRCGSCDFSQYCNKDCQKLAWKMHRAECRRLKAVFPNLPLTEVLFMSRVIDRVLFLEIYGDKFGWEAHRKWSDLMGHEEDIRADEIKYGHFKKIHEKMALFRKDEMIPEEKFFQIFCKVSINSHSIHTSAGIEIGLALDLGVSAYDHSCRPNCSMVFDGFRVCLRPLTPDSNPYNTKKSFISYIDVGRSRYQRRKDLKAKWYFECRCERCEDPNDDVLTSLKCVNASCDEPILTHETAEVMMISCAKCNTIADEDYIRAGQEKMLSLPPRYSLDSDTNKLQEMYDDASKILHTKNIYLCRMQTAIFHITGKLQENLGVVQKQIFENYKMCFPSMDRHNGFQLLHMVKALIEKGDRAEAVSYAYDAMCIFEIAFGMNHPYYLQTLALWTFLDTKANKTNEELYQLMHFGKHNKPVDLEHLLA
ncbi:hypothetical protein QR680_002302 [Steinernema hermaphroditum]|uniref:MYND-type domain-containing protein n=1 Tax=Steinernema hermaphroditum TaxID=289476 RepID=A0AA39LHV6_9BILA|nr:hypothetical protein QR680_002302 [Steinernema hermaphroditum]